LDSNRQQKVGKLFQEELAEAFRKWTIEFYPGNIISVTEVKVSPDLGVAKVYVSVFPNDKKDEIVKEIKNQNSLFRGILSKGAAKSMRITPELVFKLDNTLDEMDKIDRALNGKGNNPLL